ncbi:unnamed protein product [Rhizoctonia solani]|uniref:Ricin B lectin domain-containing protein n=1 Tax=Rhizoctonia solani TaxID=456999 RepID=A0A8H3DH09_9AGAM|nr:unnamed protein product [Rhizoctonia solani]
MGQSQSAAAFSPNNDLEPGTYRIIHDESNKALQIQDEDKQSLIISGRDSQGSDRQVTKDHWFLLRSGDGYIFKHCQHGSYISISFQSDYPYPILATQYPTSWVIFTKEGSSRLECVIATDKAPARVISLNTGYKKSVTDGDRLHLTKLLKNDKERWRLERIGDATGDAEETRLLRQQLKIVKTELVEDKSRLKIVEEQLAANLEELETTQIEFSKRVSELEEQREAVDQTNKELSAALEEASEKDTRIIEKDREISEKDESIRIMEMKLAEKDRIIAQLKEVARGSNMQQPRSTSHSPQRQAIYSNRVSPSPKPTLAAIAQSTQSRTQSDGRTALDTKLAELGWDSD